MSGLQNFVKGNRNGRPGSPQDGQPPVNQQRLAHAANLKIPMNSGVARPFTGQGLHGRGESVAQHYPASLQRRPSGEGRKRDPYDTDAESLDTTLNHSVIQVENTQQLHQQQLQPETEASESGDDEEGSEEISDDGDEDGEGFAFTEQQFQYLEIHDMLNASNQEQAQFLSQGPSHLFPTVDGDSYPTTTDGNPTEWDEQQEQQSQNPGSPSPSPQGLLEQRPNTSIFNQQSLQRNQGAGAPQTNPAMPQNFKIYQQGAQIRGQQRTEAAVHARQQSGHQHNTGRPPTSQSPSYSQANHELGLAAPSTTHARPGVIFQGGESGYPQRSSRLPSVPLHTQNPNPKTTEPATISKRASATRTKVVPIIQQPAEPVPVEESSGFSGDYDLDVLTVMNYDQLRDESFDKSPREEESALPEDMREKPLPERLQFAQQRLEPADQAKFFSALPTNEWEDAGDWFLDQFTAIVRRAREARQKKRKEAQYLEKEIEKRHQHVAKKQRLVEGAMVKMRAQGEGLVPRSPRASKSPRPRRG